MAQANHPSSNHNASSFNDEEPLERFAHWLQANAKLIGYVVGGAAVIGAGVLYYRSSQETKRVKASAALYEAQEPFAAGKFDEARTALEKVVNRYGATSAGQQAVLLLAQAAYEQDKYDEGLKVLNGAISSASSEFKPSMEALIASGYEMKGDFAQAADHYAKAAAATPFEADKYTYQASQARSLMSAGKNDEAKTIWESLATLDGQSVQAEANIRLGELAARK